MKSYDNWNLFSPFQSFCPQFKHCAHKIAFLPFHWSPIRIITTDHKLRWSCSRRMHWRLALRRSPLRNRRLPLHKSIAKTLLAGAKSGQGQSFSVSVLWYHIYKLWRPATLDVRLTACLLTLLLLSGDGIRSGFLPGLSCMLYLLASTKFNEHPSLCTIVSLSIHVPRVHWTLTPLVICSESTTNVSYGSIFLFLFSDGLSWISSFFLLISTNFLKCSAVHFRCNYKFLHFSPI